jgi:hypothetical protein
VRDRIILQRLKVSAQKTSLSPPVFIEVPLSSQKSEWSSIWVLGTLILPISKIVLLIFETVSTRVFFVLLLQLSEMKIKCVWCFFFRFVETFSSQKWLF